MLYPKLALTNLKKNKSTYIPYMLTCIGSILTFFILLTISLNIKPDSVPSGAGPLKAILGLGVIVIGIFAVVFLFYTNSFLLKRRKKELGLYSILGLEKKHIARILLFETLMIAGITLVIGLITGVVFGKLLFLLLLNMATLPVNLSFTIYPSALLTTIAVFGAIFLLMLFSNYIRVKLSNPIDLLKGGEKGEKEPKTSWVLTIFGVLTLAAGYYIAIVTKNPLQALSWFFIAVIMVIIGTYALFTTGSIALLKLLRKNKNFYYKSNNFISVSGMIYRMKQNAVGLANICILSTMVLVIVSTTVALFLGSQEMLRTQFPNDIRAMVNMTDYETMDFEKVVADIAQNNNVKTKNKTVYRNGYLSGLMENGNALRQITGNEDDETLMESYVQVMLLPLEDYNTIMKDSQTLQGDEVLLFANMSDYGQDTIKIGDTTYSVKKELADIGIAHKATNVTQVVMDAAIYLVLPDVQSIITLVNGYGQSEIKADGGMNYTTLLDLDGSKENCKAFAKELAATTNQPVRSLHLNEQEFNSIYGGFLFIGIFLGILFLMATVLIIYFKQISEGYQDHDRFKIMQKVGLDKREVRRTIQKQVLMVFFLPLVGAVIHIGVAFLMITRLLGIFYLYNIPLFLGCTAATILVFGILYTIVYALTAKVYYKMVQS